MGFNTVEIHHAITPRFGQIAGFTDYPKIMPNHLSAETYRRALDWIGNNTASIYHPSGTCKVESDKSAVVDKRLRVHDIQGLRVADASIMQELISATPILPQL